MHQAIVESTHTNFPLKVIKDLTALDTLLEDNIDGVLWERRIPPATSSTLAAMKLSADMGERFCLPPDHVSACIRSQLSSWGLGLGEAQHWLAEDVEALAIPFATMMSARKVILRIEVIGDDACRKFHRDAMRARLICTYTGPGTEYGVAAPGEVPASIAAAPTACPIVLKGKAWPTVSDPQFVHRSPPIKGTGISRLVVVIDEA